MADRTVSTTTNLVEYTVSELAFALKRTVEDAYGLVRLRGEISGYKGPHSSGHCYFTLKDENACIEAVIWRSTFARLKFKPEQLDDLFGDRLVERCPVDQLQIQQRLPQQHRGAMGDLLLLIGQRLLQVKLADVPAPYQRLTQPRHQHFRRQLGLLFGGGFLLRDHGGPPAEQAKPASPHALNTHSPPIIVAEDRKFLRSSDSQAKGSASRTIKSARQPGANRPRRISSYAAWAAPSVNP